MTVTAMAINPNASGPVFATADYPVEPAPTPTISPAGGTFGSAQTVTVSSPSDGGIYSTFYYTTDGTTPDPKKSPSLSQGQTIQISASKVLNVVATRAGCSNSAVASASFTITAQAASPVASPSGGTYSAGQSVTLTSTTPNAVIYYSLDSSAPSLKYTGALTIKTNNTVLMAVAKATGYSDSSINTQTYLFTAATPVISPGTGTFSTTQSVTITAPGTPSATIRYTLDGSEPTSTSTAYSSAFSVAATTTVKAKAFFAGMTKSATATAVLTIGGSSAAAPVISSTAYQGTTRIITMTSTTTSAVIYYTVDNTTPTTSSTSYNPQSMTAIAMGTTIKAIAAKSGLANSAVTTFVVP
jgi:hypothetical protein